MKTKEILALIASFTITLSIHAQLDVISSGRVGVGTSIPDQDFKVMNVDHAGPKYAYSQIWMDNYNNFMTLNRNNHNCRNVIRFSTGGSNYCHLGMPDSDDAGSGYEFFIGPDSEGTGSYFWIESSGQVGIGVDTISDSPYRLSVAGDAITRGGTWQDSDLRVKKNIESVTGALDKINSLRGVTFEFKDDYLPSNIVENVTSWPDSAIDNTIETSSYIPIQGKRYGVIAQEVKEIIPEVVHGNEAGYYAVNYDGFIPVLIEAIKEQQVLIEELRQELDSLKSDERFKSALNSNDIGIEESSSALLYQNMPNPFNKDTEIQFYLPEKVNRATINIYNLSGVQIKNYQVVQREKGFQIIRAEELKPGMYLYSLIADGDLIDTKRMVLTEY